MKMSFHQDGEWVRCVGGYDKEFINFLKYGVRPTSYRSYDSRQRIWKFHHSWLPHVAPIARARFGEVDWASLPTEWQMQIAGAKNTPPSGYPQAVDKSVNKSPYATLFVVEHAPLEVVQASYKALARKYHPDVSGDRNKMAELNEAYDLIKKKRRCR
jgi:hypothetical protein